MKTYKLLLYMLSLLLLGNFIILPTASAQQIVRVGWYDYSPLSTYHPEKLLADSDSTEDRPGVYGGYTYEYLRMISQVNGWQLRFIPGTITESLQRLQNGEVDIVGGIGKTPSREQLFAFPANSALQVSIGLIARADDTRFTMNDFDSFRNMRVGAVTASNPLFHAENWSRERKLPLQFVCFNNFQELYEALDNGSVDAIADSLIAPLPRYKILASMQSQGVYFIGNKNNPGLMQELDDAITQIQYLHPGYQEALASKYLYSGTYSSFTLSQREREYLNALLASGRPLRVAFAPDWFPIEYFSGDTVHGIIADVFARISELTGLKFEFVRETELTDPGQQADIVATMNTDFSWGDLHNTYLTQSVFDVPIFLVSQPEPKNFEVVAVLRNSHLEKSLTERLANEEPSVQYLYADTAQDCMNAVRDGRAGRTYINAFELNYYMNQNKFSHLKIQPVPGFTESSSIGISKNSDPLLCSIFCQALRSIPPAEMNSIILKNTTFSRHRGLLDFIYAYPLGTMASVALFCLLLGGVLFFYYSSQKNKHLSQQLEDTLNSRLSLLQANKELSHLSQYDPLTGLPNRRGLDEFLARSYAENTHLTLAMMDIDEFKRFNDTYGHLAGDQALSATAKVLERSAVVTGGFAARFGGEEFLWVDTLHTHEETAAILTKIQSDLARQNILYANVPTGYLTISIGYAEKQPEESLEALLKRADEALYEAKRRGRNQIVAAAPPTESPTESPA